MVRLMSCCTNPTVAAKKAVQAPTAVITTRRAHESWDEDLAEDLYLVPLDGDRRALTNHTGLFAAPAVSPDA